MTTQAEVSTTEITMDQFNDTKGQARGGRGPSGEVDVIRSLAIGKGVSFPKETFNNKDVMSEDGKTVITKGEYNDKNRVRLANRIMSDSSKNEYFIRTKRADNGTLLVMKITEAQYKVLHPETN